MCSEEKNTQAIGVGAKVCRCPSMLYEHKNTNKTSLKKVCVTAHEERPVGRQRAGAYANRTRKPGEGTSASVCRLG